MNAPLLVNILGFSVGIALYALLGAMVVVNRGRRTEGARANLLLATSGLGLLWNAGELYGLILKDFGNGGISPVIIAVSFAALGFLPSVVVHSAHSHGVSRPWIAFAAYGVSTIAAVLHLQAAVAGSKVPSGLALGILTFSSLALAAGLLVLYLRRTLERKAVLASALLVFALSALHLGGEREGSAWYIELAAHQSSLPLALVILYQNYRFAFADLFLKRAVSLIVLTGLALGIYAAAAVPVLRLHEAHDPNDVQAIATMIALWVGTALLYPSIYRFAVWLVDKVLLRRADYVEVQRQLSAGIDEQESVERVLETATENLAATLTARVSSWQEDGVTDRGRVTLVIYDANEVRIIIPTADSPGFDIFLGDFSGGRRLLSDDIHMLEAASLLVARRIDMLRVSQERYEQKFREQDFARLAAEAQLSALRAQINPHFLFNALTTIGYLIKTSPDRAYDTLLILTRLLRRVLKSTEEFSTLGDEIELVKSYLEIEQARFEEKLTVDIDVPKRLETLRIPSLILQPIVENAVKHGISESRDKGHVRVSADIRLEDGDSELRLTVWNSGSGKNAFAADLSNGVGLRNVRERLRSHYGRSAQISLDVGGKNGTTATIEIPVNSD